MLKSLFTNDTNTIAQKLLGMKLRVNINQHVLQGFIVETESYLGAADECSHSFGNKRTKKNESMYENCGTWYVYQIYGYNMLNLVTKPKGIPEAILIRAIEPINFSKKLPIPNGPGKLTKALGITRALDGSTLDDDFLSLAEGKSPVQIATSPRIGVKGSSCWCEKPLRFFVKGNPYVSKLSKKAQQAAEKTWQ